VDLLENNITWERCTETFHDFLGHLTEGDIAEACFQQDSATCPAALASVRDLSLFFGDRIISKGLWPPRSPDLLPPDTFLYGYIKDSTYCNNSKHLDELKNNISNTIGDISQTASVL
jgi:hypothetical protein